jgi:raffinose/stachyose/melibiose transport system permease protein
MENTLKTNTMLEKKLNPISKLGIKKILIYALLIILALGQIFPLIWLINYSLVKSSELFGNDFLKWPQPFQWINYVHAWVDGHILLYFVNSIIVVGISVVFAVLFSFMLAYACMRMDWKLRTLTYSFVMLGMMIPIHATLLPNFMLFNSLKITDTYWALIIPYTAFNLAFNTMVYSGFLKTIPRALEESALIDGCSIWGAMFKIIAPITKPAMVTVAIMTFIGNWNEFIMVNTFISSDNLRTLPFSVYKFTGEYSSDYAIQFACMVLVALPSLLIYFILNKYITEGVTMGAVKG